MDTQERVSRARAAAARTTVTESPVKKATKPVKKAVKKAPAKRPAKGTDG